MALRFSVPPFLVAVVALTISSGTSSLYAQTVPETRDSAESRSVRFTTGATVHGTRALPFTTEERGSTRVVVSQSIGQTENDSIEVAITHSASTSISGDSLPACMDADDEDADEAEYTTQNSYWRVFDLNESPLGPTFDVTSVDIGVWSVEGPPIASSVRLYRLEGDFVTANLDLIGQADFMLTGGLSMQVINVPVTATFRSDEIMVVEWYISSGDATKSFAFAGGNMHGQSGPSYVTAPHCEVFEPTDVWFLGSDDHWVLTVNGTTSTDFAVTAPAEDEIVRPGETYSVRFTVPGEVETVNLYLVRTFDPAGPRTVLAEGLEKAGGLYEWEIPDDFLSPSTFIIVVDADDPEGEGRSERFRVREPWRLHRVVGTVAEPAYEPIFLQDHAWAFSQDTEEVWPQSYWQQPIHFYGNINTGYDPFVGPEVRYHPNYFQVGLSADAHPSWPSVVRAFGVQGTYTSLEPLPELDKHFNQPNPLAAAYWTETAKQIRGYGGICYGLALGMMAAFQDPHRFSQRWLPGTSTERLAEVPLTDAVRDAAHALFVYQSGRVQQSKMEVDRVYDPKTPRDVLEQLKIMFENDVRDLDRVLVMSSWMNEYDNNGEQQFGAHAVVPLGMDSVGAGVYAVGVWDPSLAPAGSGRSPENPGYITIDSTLNAWTHSSPKWVGATGKGLFLSMDAIYALETASTTWPHLFEAQGPAVAPSAYRAAGQRNAASALEEVPMQRVMISGRAGAVKAEAGELRFGDGELVESLTGGFISFPITGGPSQPDAYVVPPGAGYRADVVPRSDGTARVHAETTDLGVTFVLEATTAERASVELLHDGLAVIEGGDGVVSLAVRSRTGTSEFRTLHADRLSTSDATGLQLTLAEDADAFRLSGATATGPYDLTLSRTVAGELRTFFHPGIMLAAGAAHTIQPEWRNLGEATVTVEVDLDGDGEPDETLRLENHGVAVSIGPEGPTPSAFSLATYPNPTRGATTLRMTVPTSGDVRVELYDLLGRRVAVLHAGPLAVGLHELHFDAALFPSGIYVVHATGPAGAATQRVTVVR